MKALRITIVLLLIVASAIGGYWLSQQDAQFGQVFIRVAGQDINTSLPKLGLLILIMALLLFALWKLLCLPFRAWSGYRRRKGWERLSDGLAALNQGQWARAEKLLNATAKDPIVGGIALAGAVRAADARGDDNAAQKYLQALEKRDPNAQALLQAERLIARRHPESALDLLDAAAQPLPPRGLWLRIQALEADGRSAEAYGQLGALKRTGVLTAAGLNTLEPRLAAQSLREAADTHLLAECWESLSRPLRANPQVVAVYAERAAALGWNDATLRSLEKALDSNWDESLIALYGRLPIDHLDSRRASAQRWLKSHSDSPALLLTLGRLAGLQEQWEQSREFLRRALELGAGAEAWEELGDGFNATHDDASARRCYFNALKVLRGGKIKLSWQQDLREITVADNTEVTETRNEHGFPQLPG
ncbi:MAG: heme biosynthesis protein HemY [Xanthomonadaceae bacterium]|jgi:HemY protein|nr:heme biosynthesis protein HemY [Xanthomonadaceae bacterium]